MAHPLKLVADKRLASRSCSTASCVLSASGRAPQQFCGFVFALVLLAQWPTEGVARQGEWTEPVKLGAGVNGPAFNHFPFISLDRQRLYLSANLGIQNEDIYICTWSDSLNTWLPRQKLGPEVNTPERELSPCESPDRKYLWFTRWNGSQSYDLYYSTWDTLFGEWGLAVNAGPTLNSSCSEWAVSITPDGRRMFVVHGLRPGTVGCDAEVLWIAYWNESLGWWDTLTYMGDTVNIGSRNLGATMSLDTSVFLLASSNHWNGVPKFGVGGDLYSVLNWAPQWDSITSLGLPPNSYDRDEGVSISADGFDLFISSFRDSLKSTPDIYHSRWTPSVGVHEGAAAPPNVVLSEPFPNPFNSAISFRLTLSSPQFVQLTIFNLLGRTVHTMLEATMPAGVHYLSWQPAACPAGVYFVRLLTSQHAIVRKVLYLK